MQLELAQLPLIDGDYTQLEQVVSNLLENAARHAPVGSTVRFGGRDAGDHVEIWVDDEGPASLRSSDAPTARRVAAHGSSSAFRSAMPSRSELILVVDDEPGIVRALHARDHRVAVATTGAEALAEVTTRNPAVIILDLGLPDIDGIEVCRQLRRWTDTPIIVLTAEGAESRKGEALDEGADDYVTKPFSTPDCSPAFVSPSATGVRPTAPRFPPY